MEFQTRLYDLRKKAGLSQEELANLVGVTRQAVQKWEAGASRPDMDNLAALARYFDVTLDWLITGREAEKEQPEAERVVVEHHYHPYVGWHYEYRSRCTLWGLPLVHINLSQRGLTWARGIIAIGNVATGLVAVGCFAAGLLSVGAICLGLLVIAGIALGVVSIGCISIGMLAFGGVALGYLAVGGSCFGIYAVGGAAGATDIAVGAAAGADLLAIGRDAQAAVTLSPDTPREVLSQAIAQAGAPDWVRAVLLWFCR